MGKAGAEPAGARDCSRADSSRLDLALATLSVGADPPSSAEPVSVGVAAIVAVALALAAARAGVGTRAAGMAATACGIVPRSSTSGIFDSDDQVDINRSDGGVIGITHTFSSRVTNDFRFGFQPFCITSS